MRIKRKQIRVAAIFWLVLLVGACQRPDEVTTAASLVVSNTDRLKTETAAYAAGVNSSRAASEQRLRGFEIEASIPAEFVNRRIGEWKVADNKSALNLLEILRADSSDIAADPFAFTGFGAEFSRARTFSFGRIKPNTAAFDTIIKNISSLSEERSLSDQLEHLIEFGIAVKSEVEKLNGIKDEGGEGATQ